MSKKTIIIFLLILNLIFMSLIIYYEKEDKRYISKVKENDNISMLKIVGEDTEVIKQVPQSGQWSMSYTCDDENAELYWNEKKRTVVAKNISATECTLIFRESDAIFRMISMYVDGEYVTELDNTKKYEMESYECTNGEELTWDFKSSKLSIQPISKDTSCYVNFNEKHFTLTEKILADNTAQSDAVVNFSSPTQNIGLNGLFYTSDTTKTENGEVVYYYRGIVENNYLVFGNYCWRVVRTVEDGSVRLRYSGAVTVSGETYTCTQTRFDIEVIDYNGYCNDTCQINERLTAESDLDYKTNDVKQVVENWYRDNIVPNTALTSLIQDTPYCADMTGTTSDIHDKNGNKVGYSIKYVAYDRLEINKTPQYKCENPTYAYTVAKGDLTYPVALLTADEVAYAGGFDGGVGYYYDMGSRFATMTISEFGSRMAYDMDDKLYYPDGRAFIVWESDLYTYRIGVFSGAALPVISLKNEAAVKKGTGVYNDPYVILTNE